MQNLSTPAPEVEINGPKLNSAAKSVLLKQPGKWLSTGVFYAVGILFLSLFSNNYAIAQTPCKTGCTSNDVQIMSAYLMQDRNGTPLQACASGTPVQAYLYLDLITNTPRVGVSITANIYNKTTQVLVQAVGECFGQSLSSGGTSVTTVKFTNPIAWTCGAQIELKDVLIGWGTGSSNFCVGTAAQCPATSSKCWKQSATTYIPVVTFPCTAPYVTSQPANQQKCAGQSASFTVGYTEGNPTGALIQWQLSTDNGNTWNNLANTAPYSGVTTATLSISSAAVSLNGYKYKAVLTNNTTTHNCGTSTNGAATLSVNSAPTINAQPVGLTKCAGANAIFTVGFTGGSPAPGIQWQVKTPGGTFTDIANATLPTLTLSYVTSSLNGNEYRAVLSSGACTAVTSNAAVLTVDATPTTATVGNGQTRCGTLTSAGLGGNSSSIVGTGAWSKKSGPGSVTFSNVAAGNATATVSAVGTYVFTWTISNGICASSAADITVNYYATRRWLPR